MATRTINPDELRNRFRAAQRMPQLLEVRDMVRVAMRQTSDEMDAGEGGDGMAELQGLFAALKSLLDQIDEAVTRRATLEDVERRAHGTPLRDGTDRDFLRQCCEFSLFRAAGHAIGLRGIDASREIEVQNELAKRAKDKGRSLTGNVVLPYQALSVQVRHLSRGQLTRYETRDIVGPVETRVIGSAQPPGTTGGSLIGTYTDPTLYVDVLRPSMAIRQAGARVLSDMRENLRLPRMTQSGTPGWFAENSPIPTSDEAFDDIVLVPHHDGAIVEVTRNMLQQANPEIEAIVRNDLALKLANDVDRAALAGTGVAPQPLGIVTDPLVPNLPAAALSYDGLVDLIGSLATKNALAGSLAWIGDANVMVAGKKVVDLYGRPLGDELLYHGYPTYWTNLASLPAAPTDPMVFGNWSDLIVAFWSELDVLVNPYESTAFSKGNVEIRAAMTLDIAKRHPESFAWMSMTAGGAAAEAARTPTANRSR
jgi:HK97 family phage major capsid protein